MYRRVHEQEAANSDSNSNSFDRTQIKAEPASSDTMLLSLSVEHTFISPT